jgi:RNA polymerase sigma-70 factor (ECF subfamily)
MEFIVQISKRKYRIAIVQREAHNSEFKPKSQQMSATKPQVEVSESALIERVIAGDAECFYQLVCPYERSIYVAALSILQNAADAEEVAQEAVLKAFKNIKQFRCEAKFSTWLIQITINEARLRLRKDRKALYESIDDANEDDEGAYIPRDFADWREVPSEALERTELRNSLQKAIAALPEKYRDVFILRDVEHVSIADTAVALGISEVNVRTRLHRARLMVRDALAPGYDGGWRSETHAWKKVRPW